MNVDSKPKQVVEKATTEENKNKYKDYGSKIAKVLEKFDEVLQANPNAKIILFVQYRRLANLIESALNNFQIPLVRLHGTTAMRNRAISGFKYNNQTKVIMLSSEDSVSGLHLPEATHIFIVHPFWFGDGKDDQAIAAEKQGIARAYRMGLDHELQVYRFVTRNTIEESVAKARL
ncbi:hypothetical protein ROZALSC1DRAFT_28836 [Rozella allomycis CSF55]|uniref:p-loop containing nucleoside triphosphate hydrolase domain-containing protein n=1 Tax=Rozella allomycis (strain CSF55) TaxID=988480 RepID=A0A075AME2_ROZAC|nr:P-loop containing nucleoside triphosphate hydrolase domain-containing protein [Rozella allomycis CSF55]RKP19590.1 hypothetical protein ROZALSC1DRAFT_28836 [Rozella allomycis CSF55]|eukprot:EPZ30756.1 P-loop containing nucleoside triphosphate hydrolase domain-containing protein [Rozella allomycis CSF55]